MIQILIAIILVLALIIVGLLVWLINTTFANRENITSQSSGLGLLQQQIEALKSSQNETKQTLQKSLSEGQTNLNKNLQSSQKVLNDLHKQIGSLSKSNEQMKQLGTDVRRLHDILNSPKLRGQMGETSLENLLSQVLPQDTYEMQYTMKNGKMVDAIIHLNSFSIPIDAKFPLPSFENMCKAQSDDERKKLRKQFIRDVNSHINKISESYIQPAEGTVDFAMMYIPAENVYYETIIKENDDTKDLTRLALDKKIIPVSPNLLYAYLMTVVMGLHGMQIEQQAENIRQNLNKLNDDFARFLDDFEVLGKHLRNSSNKYDEAGKRLDRFTLNLEQIQQQEISTENDQ